MPPRPTSDCPCCLRPIVGTLRRELVHLDQEHLRLAILHPKLMLQHGSVRTLLTLLQGYVEAVQTLEARYCECELTGTAGPATPARVTGSELVQLTEPGQRPQHS
jgi:hypothetical protein